MNTFDEIIRFAIEQEEAAAAFYEGFSTQSKKKEIQQIFVELAKQEKGHKAKLESVLSKHEMPSGKKLYPDPDLKIADYLVEIQGKVEELSYQDALILAMKRELASQKLYQDLLSQATDDELKTVFTYLLDEEKKHKHQLEAEYDDQILKEN